MLATTFLPIVLTTTTVKLLLALVMLDLPGVQFKRLAFVFPLVAPPTITVELASLLTLELLGVLLPTPVTTSLLTAQLLLITIVKLAFVFAPLDNLGAQQQRLVSTFPAVVTPTTIVELVSLSFLELVSVQPLANATISHQSAQQATTVKLLSVFVTLDSLGVPLKELALLFLLVVILTITAEVVRPSNLELHGVQLPMLATISPLIAPHPQTTIVKLVFVFAPLVNLGVRLPRPVSIFHLAATPTTIVVSASISRLEPDSAPLPAPVTTFLLIVQFQATTTVKLVNASAPPASPGAKHKRPASKYQAVVLPTTLVELA
jgi:hypothetical protein